jgi:hypothetical protein
MFAPGIVAGFGEHSPVTFSPDLDETYCTREFRGPIMFSRRVNRL